MEEFRAAITGDWQVPYVDRDAVDVATQIIKAFRPKKLVFNGDIFDLLNLSRFPNVKTELNERTAIEFESEIDTGVAMVKAMVKETKPEQVHWLNGNHEWRLLRAIANADHAAKRILELKVVRKSYSYPSLFRFDEIGVPVHFVGEYPKGTWLHPSLPAGENVWIEHGYVARKKSGFTANALMEERMCSVICGHCHRAALLWRHVNGNRNLFAVEGGGLSILGTPGEGDGMYFGTPHSEPDYMNSTQGFTLATYAEGRWWPELIRIHGGRALWRGKMWTSRVKKTTQIA